MNQPKRAHVAIRELPGVVDAVRGLSAGNVGPVQILDECLERIEASEAEIGAWVEIDTEGARRAAARQGELPREEARGLPLLGIPIAVKDIIDAAGLPTKAGSALRDGHTAHDATRQSWRSFAPSVQSSSARPKPPSSHARIRRAPAIPGNLDRSPGGSSAGSAAAVASGMCLAALGTQTGGSITRPASFCGAASFKGRWGGWPLESIVPVSQNLDHVGPMARSVEDLALLWTLVEARLRPERAAPLLARWSEAIIAGDWFGRDRPPRLAVIEEYFYEASEPAALAAFEACIERSGGRGGGDRASAAACELRRHACEPPSGDGGRGRQRCTARISPRGPTRTARCSAGSSKRALSVSAVDYRAARLHQQRFSDDFAAALDSPVGPDIVVTPATVASAPPLSERTTGDPQFNSVWSFSGLPTCGVPACLGEDGLPLSLQLGAGRESPALFQAAAWCEAALVFPGGE